VAFLKVVRSHALRNGAPFHYQTERS
jgi:hypothetical protein